MKVEIKWKSKFESEKAAKAVDGGDQLVQQPLHIPHFAPPI